MTHLTCLLAAPVLPWHHTSSRQVATHKACQDQSSAAQRHGDCAAVLQPCWRAYERLDACCYGYLHHQAQGGD